MEEKERLAWISLALEKGVGPKAFQRIYECGFSAAKIYECDLVELEELGFSKKLSESILRNSPSNPSGEVEQALKWAESNNHHLITLHDSEYPKALKQIASAPPLLMVKGSPKYLSMPQLAVVGSRYPTQAGQAQAFEFSEALSDLGIVVTSGLAKGVDSYAHKGALQAGGATIAVLGTGLNQIYPKSNQRLANEVAEKGALVSEFSLGSPAVAGHFPRRNRIVSGLSLGVLVIEATLKSGSLITARQALEQNREVFALPGSLSNPQKAGCHYLIRQGAELIEEPEQIIECLRLQIHPVESCLQTQSPRKQELDMEASPEQYAVLKNLDYDGTAIDELVNRTRMSIHELSVMLMDMELSGLVRQEQGLYARV